jgi:hypothetical protein
MFNKCWGERAHPRALRYALCAALALAAGMAWAAEEGLAPAAIPDDRPAPTYGADVRPIFARHCLRCHGPDKQEAMLRLDDRDLALRGGASGKPLLGRGLDDSELWRRVTAQDDAVVMPPDDERLSAEEIDVLRRWIERGGIWSNPVETPTAGRSESFWRWIEPYLDLAEYYQGAGLPKFVGLLAGLLAVLAIERLKTLYRRQHRWSQGRARRLFAAAARVSPAWYVAVAAAAFAAEYAFHKRQALAVSERRIEELTEQIRALNQANNPGSAAVYGSPPVPIQPLHPDRLGGTYYRGNDERNPALFNGGFYCTCKFHVLLCDADGRALAVGDAVPDAGLWVRVEVERARGTTPSLFTDDILLASCLSRQVVEDTQTPRVADEPQWFQTVESEQRWVATYPLGRPTETTASGLIYVYKTATPGDFSSGLYHYGVQYELQLEDGRIAAGSKLWMGSLYITGNLQLPRAGQIQLNEWFDWRPIPEIEGQNTTDPDLLGIPEHLGTTAVDDAAGQPPEDPETPDPHDSSGGP